MLQDYLEWLRNPQCYVFVSPTNQNVISKTIIYHVNEYPIISAIVSIHEAMSPGYYQNLPYVMQNFVLHHKHTAL